MSQRTLILNVGCDFLPVRLKTHFSAVKHWGEERHMLLLVPPGKSELTCNADSRGVDFSSDCSINSFAIKPTVLNHWAFFSPPRVYIL